MDNKVLYEKFDWSKLKEKHLKEKRKKILDNIPSDVYSIIDVGCGNGVITNVLGKKYKATTIDRNKKAFEFIETKKDKANRDNFQLGEKAFNMIFSNKLFEYITKWKYKNKLRSECQITVIKALINH